MKLKNFFWTSETITSFFWVIFFLILFFTEPTKANTVIFVAFFTTLFLAILGTFGLLEFRLTLKYKSSENVKNKMFTAFRHGFMVAVVLVGLLFMEGVDVLTFWDGGIFVLAILLIEGYFLSKDNNIVNNN